jgi:guanylate kinase
VVSTNGDGTPLLVVVSGPSGVGKDAVLLELRKAHPEIFIAVTATTRPQRPGETDGHDYIFVTPARFQSLLERDELLEHAEVYGRFYGVPKAPLRQALADGLDAIVKVDVQGAATIREIAPDAVLIFLTAPSMEELERRLTSRKTESPEQMALRIQTAREELEQASRFDFVIVNETDAVAETVEQIAAIIASQRLRAPPRQVVL